VLRLELNAKSWRQVVYRGKDTSFVDEKVRDGHRYKYLVQAIDGRSHVIGTSDVVDVAVPPIVIDDPAPKPVPVPRPKPEPMPEPKPEPRPEPKPEPRPEAKPVPSPEPVRMPLPTPKPEPVPPEPKPAPLPDPRPLPPVARMKLACAPQRVAVDGSPGTKNTDPAFAPVGVAVACEWAAPADLKVAGYALWRAERPDGTRQVIFKSVDATRYVDRAVSSGHSYVYVVKAFDANGRVIGQSDAVTVSFPMTTTATDTGAAA
jgi:hypothetical protein